MSVMNIIKAIRESDNLIPTIYTYGGCYQFSKILKEIFPNAKQFEIPDKHTITLINGEYYDINGIVKFEEWDCAKGDLIDPTERMMNTNFSNNKYFYQECPNCEDLVAFTSDIFIERNKELENFERGDKNER